MDFDSEFFYGSQADHLRADCRNKNPPKDQRSHIFDAMAEQNYSKGDVIIKQGDPGNYFYVIGKHLAALSAI